MKTIHKYPVDLSRFVRRLPQETQILSVQTQDDQQFMWVLVDTEVPKVNREFVVYRTGHEIPAELEEQLFFIGTFQLNGGMLVFHLFEILDG